METAGGPSSSAVTPATDVVPAPSIHARETLVREQVRILAVAAVESVFASLRSKGITIDQIDREEL